jgi:hypothetical protein
MQIMKKVIALFSLCAAVMTAFANANGGLLPGDACFPGSELAVILKGTIQDKIHFTNDGATCVGWDKTRRKYDVYAALCYTEIDCTDCDQTAHIDPDRSFIVLIDKAHGTVVKLSFGELGEDAYELLCLGSNDIALAIHLGQFDLGWFVLTGKRDCKYGFTSLSGVGTDLWEVWCYGEVAITDIKVRRDDSLTKKLYGSQVGNPYCPQCTEQSTPCDKLDAVLMEYLTKKYPNIFQDMHDG